VSALDITPMFIGFSLYMIRVSVLVLVVPVFGTKGGTQPIKVGLSATVAFLLLQANGFPAMAYAPPVRLVFPILGEVVIGLAMGLGIRLMLTGLTVGGHMLGQEMGLNMSTLVDPITGRRTPAVASLFETIGMLLFFIVGMHHAVFRVLALSFQTYPPGRVRFEPVAWAHWVTSGLSTYFEYGIRLVAPALAVLLTVTLSFGLLMRAVPTINVFDIGFVLRILVAFSLLALLLPHMMPVAIQMLDTLHEGLVRFVRI
jgi:flagellar biosynthesis protein FliR